MKRIKKIIIIFLPICIVVLIGIIMLSTNYAENKDKRAMQRRNEIIGYHNELFGENVYFFTPEDPVEEVCQILDELWEQQETNEFGLSRYGIYFMPGSYDSAIEVKVGYYMEVAGLGLLPSDTKITALNCNAGWLGDESNHNACCNFWRGVQNLTVTNDVMWAVSQATFMRRVLIEGNLALHDDSGWASGGYLADSVIEGIVDSGSQQQWLSRNNNWKMWLGQNWNMVFVGIGENNAPVGTWPGTRYTTVEETPRIREKPFLFYNQEEGYQVFIPNVLENTMGNSWKAEGEIRKISDFYVALPEVDTSESINTALAEGKSLILTPGIYKLDDAIKVENEGTIVMGMGFATLFSKNGKACMEVSDVSGIIVTGLLFDAGENESETLLKVGKEEKTNEDNEKELPIVLSDLFFRVGGNAGYIAKTKSCIVINADQVIGDNFWIWRADHGDGVDWDKNTAENGIIVNGNDVTIYALMVEHFQEYQTIWNGENGRVYFYQSEIPYDVPNQESWVSHEGRVNGYSSYKVGENVKKHEAWGLGIYSYHRDAKVDLFSAMEVPNQEEVKIHNVCAIMITGNPGISHIINDQGAACKKAGDRMIIREYAHGVLK